jgi:hypothetical protein
MKQDNETSALKVQAITEKNIRLTAALQELRSNDDKSQRIIEEIRTERDHLKAKVEQLQNLLTFRGTEEYLALERRVGSRGENMASLEQVSRYIYTLYNSFLSVCYVLRRTKSSMESWK